MFHRRRTRLSARPLSAAGKLSRERIIPVPRLVETSSWVVMAVTVRGSMLVVALLGPLIMIPELLTPEVLPGLALLLTASHGTSLVRQRVRLH